VQSTEPTSGWYCRIGALVPSSELTRYATELRAATGGRGRYRARHDHYDVLPSHLVDRVVASAGA
jgi:elongation factor G